MTPYSRALAEAQNEVRETGRAAVREYDAEDGHHWLCLYPGPDVDGRWLFTAGVGDCPDDVTRFLDP